MTIRDYRYSLGLTQYAMAKKLDVSIGSIQSWEQGARNPSRAMIKLIKAKYKKDITK